MTRTSVLLISFSCVVGVAQASPPQDWGNGTLPHVSGGLSLGYDTGLPLQGHLLFSDLADGLPLSLRLSVAHTFLLDGGRPEDARHVFINENNNGVPEKTASRWAFGFDLLHRVNILAMKRAFLFGGIRYSRFTATFDFVGGNELFDVHANQWGLAAGIESYFRMSSRVDLLFSVGTEYFFPSTLEGHDSAYSPDGQMINQREDYTYDDADHAIRQPKIQPHLLIGINYTF